MEGGVPGDMKVMGVIPARYQSSRLPGKPLADIHGKPMIYWVAKRVEASCLTSYCVATDDQRIADACVKYEIPFIMTSGDCVNGTERVAEVSRKTDADYYVNIQGDEPCLNPEAINQIVDSLQEDRYPKFVQAISPIQDNNHVTDSSVVKVAVSESQQALYFSRSPIPFPRNGEDIIYYRCMGLYLYSREFLQLYSGLAQSKLEGIEQIEQLRVLENNICINTVVVDDDGISIDTPDDLAFVRSLGFEALNDITCEH
jgi:3-deoxy-manno-octulosonate cytidylyltransferase (CMP-KDO synthetase)